MDTAAFLHDDIVQWLLSPEDDVDVILTAAIEEYERVNVPRLHSAAPAPELNTYADDSSPRTSSALCSAASTSRPFAPVKTDAEIQLARAQGIPKKTQEDTKYCVSLWDAWRRYRLETTGDAIKPITELNRTELQHWLTCFTLEVRKKDGGEFPPSSLHHICCGLMRYLRLNGQPSIDFFSDSDFVDFKASLDAEMKRLQSEGIGSSKRQAEVLTQEEEELLWQKGLLGDATPQTLLDTMVFYNGFYFALRSGKEHRQLRSMPCQIQLVEQPGKRAFLRYTEDISKNQPGGIRGRNVKPKIVSHHANLTNSERCFEAV